MIRQEENWKAFIVANQAHYNKTNESRFNLIELTPEERGWTELFQIYPPITSSGGSGTSPVNGRSYSWTYGFLPVGYFGVKNQSRVFTSSGTWNCPADVGEIYVKCVGRGASGNNGGGGGGFIMARIAVIPGTSYAITIDSAASSFGGIVSALAANGTLGGLYAFTENVEVLFKGAGGKGGKGGGGGGSELGEGGNGSTGGGGLHATGTLVDGGAGMLSQTVGYSYSGAGFMSRGENSNPNGKGMFSSGAGLKSNVSPYYNKLSVDITENLGAWGTPNNYGGGQTGSASAAAMFSGGMSGSSRNGGGFGGGGGYVLGSSDCYGGNGGYGGGGGGGYSRSTRGYGGNGGSGGGGGSGDAKSTAIEGYGGNGGYGGGGGSGYRASGGSGGAGLVIIEW